MVTTNKEILEAIERVSAQVTRVDAKADRTNVRLDTVVMRMDSLVETTNHRLDDFTKALDGKLDNGELLTSLGFKLLNNKFGRWGLGLVVTSLAGLVTSQYWIRYIEFLVGR